MDEMPTIRIGDREREQVVDLLKRAWADGRLTMDEFNERTAEAWAARTRDDLDVLVADLPPGVLPPGASVQRSPYPVAQPPGRGGASGVGPGAPAKRSLVAVMSAQRAKGSWQVPTEVSALAFWGHVSIDLRHADIRVPVVTIRAVALMGGVDVVVPPGMRVELDGFVLMGGATDLTRSEAPAEGGPLIRVKAAGMWGGITVRTGKLKGATGQQQATAGGAASASPGPEDGDGDGGMHGHGHRSHGHRSGRGRRGQQGQPTPPAPPPALSTGGFEGIIPQVPGRRADPAPVATSRPAAAQPAAATAPAAPAAPPAPPAPPAPNPPGPSSPPGPGTAPGQGSPPIPGSAPDAPIVPALGDPPGAPVAAEAAATNGVRPTGRVLTMLVSDIVDSTQSAVSIGDQRWMGVLAAHDALFREQVRRHHGTVVKHQGDGFLVTFTSARQAVLAGIAVQRAMASHRRAYPDNAMHVRLGIHTGEVVEDDGDIFGANVITAVRIADAAEPDEVLVSGLTRDLTEAAGDLAFDDGREATLKGLARPAQVFAADWG
jgi:class 3 adenylate cyclase